MDTLSAFDYKKSDDPDTSTIEFPSYLSVLEKMEQNDVSMPFLLAPGKISSNKQRKQQTKKYKPSYIWRVIRAKDLIEEYAEIMNYSKGWVWRQTEEQKNDNNNFTDYKI